MVVSFAQPQAWTLNCRHTRVSAWLLSHARPLETPWTGARQAHLSMVLLQAKLLEWVARPSSRGASQPRDQTQVSHITGGFFTVSASTLKMVNFM